MQEARVEAQVQIEAPAQRVFDFLVRADKIPLVMPGLIENTNVELPLKEGSEFNYRYQLAGVTLEGTWRVTALRPPSVYEAQTTGGANSTWRYRLTEDEGRTTVYLTVEYETPRNVLQRLTTAAVRAMNQREAEVYMQNLRMVLEMQDAL